MSTKKVRESTQEVLPTLPLTQPTGDHRISWDHRNVNGGRDQPGRLFPQDCDPNTLETPSFRQAAHKHYSPPLLGLIVQCVAYEQEDRPTFKDLLRTIRDHTEQRASTIGSRAAGSTMDWANGMREKPKNAREWSEGVDSMKPLLQDDKYALFAKLPKLPVPPNLDAEAWRTPPLEQDLESDDNNEGLVGGGPWPGLAEKTKKNNKRGKNKTRAKRRRSDVDDDDVEFVPPPRRKRLRDDSEDDADDGAPRGGQGLA